MLHERLAGAAIAGDDVEHTRGQDVGEQLLEDQRRGDHRRPDDLRQAGRGRRGRGVLDVARVDVDVDLGLEPESEPLAVETVATPLAVESEPLPVFGPDAAIEDAPTPPAMVEATEPVPTEPKQKAKPKAKRRMPKPKALPKKAPAPVVLEPDEGIDWSLPDFPEETGHPDAPSGAPVVIDEPPPRE